MFTRFSTLISLTMGALAAAGLAALVYSVPPTRFRVAIALFLIGVMTIGFTYPLWVVLLRKLLPGKAKDDLLVMGLRFGVWSGIFVTSLFLLKFLHFLDRVVILAILALLMMVETLLQQRQSAQDKRSKKR